MTLSDELEFELRAIAAVHADNRWHFDERAYEIVGRRIEGATARLAVLIGKSRDHVEDCAHAHHLWLELRSEWPGESERLRRMLPESFFVAVARKYVAGVIDLGDAYARLDKYTGLKDGRPWRIEDVRKDLPHVERSDDYDKLMSKFSHLLPHFLKPALMGVSEKRKKIALRLAEMMKEVSALVREYLEAQ